MAYSTNFRQPMPPMGTSTYQGSSIPPPLPPRNYGQTTSYGTSMQPAYASGYGSAFGSGYGSTFGSGYGGLGGYNSSYGGYGGGGYGGYSSYGGIGGYGMGGYRPGFAGVTPENRFIQLAEESARPAFESFQSVMGVLQSVTMMFDSTFHAVHASYASVLGVADNFSKLRSMFARVFSAFSVIKALNWLYRKILRLMRLSNDNPSFESVWTSALNEGLPGAASTAHPSRTGANWPAMGLIAMLIAGPYLIMKLISQMAPPTPPPEVWNPLNSAGTRAEVLYDFHSIVQGELTVRRNQVIMIAPKQYQPPTPGWLLACDQSKRTGLVPANYINIESSANLKTVIPRNEPGRDTCNIPSSATMPEQDTCNISASAAMPSLSNILPSQFLNNSSWDRLADSTLENPFASTGQLSSTYSALDDVTNLPSPVDVTSALARDTEFNIPPVTTHDK